MAFAIYDSTEVTVVAMGIPIDAIGGYGEDEFVKVEWDEEGFKKKTGTDGHVTRSKTNNRGAKITLTLMQSSKANLALSALYNLDKKAKNGAGVGPFLMVDRQGLTVYAASKCWIAKCPDPSMGKLASERVWQLECADLEGVDGGN